MKRDMELIRHLLFKIEELEPPYELRDIQIENYSQLEIDYHLSLMLQANLIQGKEFSTAQHKVPEVTVRNLTWAGHDFLDAARSDTVWKKGRRIAAKVGGFNFEVLKSILSKIAVEEALNYITHLK